MPAVKVMVANGVNGSVKTARDDILKFDDFLTKFPDLEYLRLQLIDNSGMRREVMVPTDVFRGHLEKQSWPAVFGGLDFITSFDTLAPPGLALGSTSLKPDLNTLMPILVTSSPSASVMTYWLEERGEEGTFLPKASCPRGTLQRLHRNLSSEFGVSALMGIEIEVCFVRPVVDESTDTISEFKALTKNHNAYHTSYEQLKILPMIEEIVRELRKVDITVPVFHAEAAYGQWEFPLPPAEPLDAIDKYYKARSVIETVAFKYGLKATLYPRPYEEGPGTAAHLHYSLKADNSDCSDTMYENFLAGVLKHLPAILGFTLPLEESYRRIGQHIWGGGEYVAWGKQYREVPVRQCGGEQHWEFRTIDGCTNMYHCASAILSAGICGLRKQEKLTIKNVQIDLGSVSEEERKALGVTTKLCTSLQESLKALEADDELREMMGVDLTKHYLEVKNATIEMMRPMAKDQRKIWLMERY
jgi:glutamine synthetase